jgi:predicted transcriptional regulator
MKAIFFLLATLIASELLISNFFNEKLKVYRTIYTIQQEKIAKIELNSKDDIELSENAHKYINNIKNSNKGE